MENETSIGVAISYEEPDVRNGLNVINAGYTLYTDDETILRLQYISCVQDIWSGVEIAISVSGVLLNLSTIVALCSIPGGLASNYKLLLSLSVSDFITAFCHIVLFGFEFQTIWAEKFSFTKDNDALYVLDIILSLIYQTNQYAALTTILAIAVDLLLAVKYPLTYNQLMTKTRGIIIVCCAWLIPFFLTCGLTLTSRVEPDTDMLVRLMPMFIVQGLSVLVFIAFVVIYAIVICEIRRFHKRAPTHRSGQLRKSSITIAILVLTYFFCFMPLLWIIVVSQAVVTRGTSNVYVNTVLALKCLFVLNATIDPVIYALRLPNVRTQYRAAFNKVLNVCKPPRQNDPGISE